REHGHEDARCGLSQLLEQHRPVHAHMSPISMMAMMGPIDAKPRRPKPSETAERPASTELTPIARAITTGAVRTPVVTPPLSYASATNSVGVTSESTIMAR